MPARRILSVWFPRLGAERLLRRLRRGQPLREAHAMCATLVTRLQNRQAEAAFLDALTRWAGRFSPWVAAERPEALNLDITGCAHLFGGEEAMLVRLEEEAAGLGLSARCGLADTLGAAWALARFAGVAPGVVRSGDAIEQEARATRSRAAKRRHWERGGAAPAPTGLAAPPPRIAPPGRAHSLLAPLPVAALRLAPEMTEGLARVGLRRVGDLLGQPRAPLARRFGQGLILRLDQAVGAVPEPVSPAAAPPRFATRLTMPEPIGLSSDMLAALDRLVPRLCALLRDTGRGARRVRLQAWRVDGTMQGVEAGLTRAADAPERIRPLLAHRVDEIDAGFGIEVLRLEAVQSEAMQPRPVTGHLEAADKARVRREK